MSSAQRPRTRPLLALGALLVGAATAGCSAQLPSAAAGAVTAAARTPASPSPSASSSATASASASASSGAAVPAPAAFPDVAHAQQPPAAAAWRTVAASPSLRVATIDHGRISLLWMRTSALRFRFVPGTVTPENGPATTADRIPSTWTSRMVAAFDGGYKLSDHVGGYYYLGRTVVPLRTGYASLVVHRDGTLAVGAWGRDVTMSADVLVVRQNLPLLVDHGRSQVRASDSNKTWGIALHGLPDANRTALGVLPDGSLVFEYGAFLRPSAMADTLVSLGVTRAIALDMNGNWPTGYLYTHNGRVVSGTRINSHIVRPPSLYLSQWRKDFIAVEPR